MWKIDFIILFGYLLGVVLFGCYFVRNSRTPDGFMLASRSLPGWAVGLSVFGTFVSSISFLALPGKAYATNWNAYTFGLSLPFAAWFAIRFFMPLYRNRQEVSAYSYLEHRFGAWARVYASLCYLLTQLVRIGAILYLIALPLESLIGGSLPVIIVTTGVLVIIYTLLGGIEAVIWTDVVQSIIFIIGSTVVVCTLLFEAEGGPLACIGTAYEAGKFSFGSFGPSLTESTFWVVFVYGIFINLQNFGIDQSYVQRYLTTPTEKEAKKSVWLGALLYIPVSATFFLIGSLLYGYYTLSPSHLPAHLQAAEMADRVFPWFIATDMPHGIRGLLVAAIAAAAMSSVDSSLNCSATLILTDYYKRFFRPQAGEKESMRVLHLATLIWGIAGTCIGLAIIPIGKNALDIWWNLSGIFSGGMLGLFLLGYFSRRTTNVPAAIAVVMGALVIFWMTFSPKLSGEFAFLKSPFHSLLITVIGTLSIFLVGLLLTHLFRLFTNQPRQT